MAISQYNFNDTVPAAPAGKILCGFQKQDDTDTQIRSISMTVPIATDAALGVVQPDGVTVDVDGNGKISVPKATADAVGLVKPDGTTITIAADGTITASGDGSSVLTTKGDLLGYDTTANRIPVGSDGTVLTADSTQALGVKWAAVSGGGSGSGPITKFASGSQANVQSVVITGLDTLHNDYRLSIRCSRSLTGAVNNELLRIQFGDTSETTVWSTAAVFMTTGGTGNGNLDNANGAFAVAQVFNNTGVTSMMSELSLQFSDDGTAVSVFAHSCFWENFGQYDSTAPWPIGAIKITTQNQAWTIGYTVYALSK
jgi:hypothetical protein